MSAASYGTNKAAEPIAGEFEHILFPRAPIHQDASLLAKFLSTLAYEEIPSDAVYRAKVIALDTIGCIAAGSDTPLGRSILATYATQQSSAGCSVPGTSARLPPSMAAKVNAWLSDVLDFEDTCLGHPSATVIPAALATAEYLGASPRQFLAGIVAGYEAGTRFHDATQATPEVYKRFAVYHAWHGIAAGAAAIVTAGGTEDQVRSALGHAAANTSLPLWYVQYGRPAHALKANFGQMALGGVDAALCAREGIVGPFAMLSDAERGFAYIIGSDRFDPQQLSAGLRKIWRIRESCLKAFPACGFLHTSVDAASKIVSEIKIDPRSIAHLTIRTFGRIADWFSDNAPASDIDAQLSVQYVCAMALLGLRPGREWYTPALLADPRVGELMSKISVEIDPVAERGFWDNKFSSTVNVSLINGEMHTATVDLAPGHWLRPMSESDVANKFLANVKGTSLEYRGEELIRAIMKLDEAPSLKELQTLLAG
ncbi:MmgE/PrpD family protein [Bradyrhizobium sp. ma5]|uniref:MmgE/PrpD family protein n=1 Tax=Bradyrhizobium sp. ma5 TaxID=3344828 RepID=UPI0035D48488